MNKEISKQQKKDYIDSGGIKCPACQSFNMTNKLMKTDIGISWNETICCDCGANWKDGYELVNNESHVHTAE